MVSSRYTARKPRSRQGAADSTEPNHPQIEQKSAICAVMGGVLVLIRCWMDDLGLVVLVLSWNLLAVRRCRGGSGGALGCAAVFASDVGAGRGVFLGFEDCSHRGSVAFKGAASGWC